MAWPRGSAEALANVPQPTRLPAHNGPLLLIAGFHFLIASQPSPLHVLGPLTVSRAVLLRTGALARKRNSTPTSSTSDV